MGTIFNTLERVYHHLYHDFKMSVKLASRVLAIKTINSCIVFDFLTVCCVIDNWCNHYHVNLSMIWAAQSKCRYFVNGFFYEGVTCFAAVNFVLFLSLKLCTNVLQNCIQLLYSVCIT